MIESFTEKKSVETTKVSVNTSSMYVPESMNFGDPNSRM